MTGCWLWTAALNPETGYGMVSGGAQNSGALYAHRVLYEHFKGPVPKGLHLDHIVCRTRCCVNPDHLRAVTPLVNALENSNAIPALNAKKTCCPKCGGPFTWQKNGTHRFCPPCRTAYGRDRYAKQKAMRA